MSYIKDLTQKLAQPVPYKWRVQGANKDRTKVQLTAYIDARQVMDILDEHCEYGWSSKFEEHGGGLFCTITIFGPDGQSWSRTDAGNRVEDNSEDQMYEQGYKAAASDAFKRASVQFSISRFLYDIEKVWLPCNEKRQPLNERGEVIWDLTKYMNEEYKKTKKSSPTVTPTSSPTPPAETKQEAASSGAKKKMTDKILSDMLGFIKEGKADVVKAKMPEYDMTLAQKTVLERAMK